MVSIRDLLLLYPAGKKAYLAYDSFTRANAEALGNSEKRGPLGLARLRLPWTIIGGDFDIVGNLVVAGDAQANLAVNGTFAAWVGDDPTGWAVIETGPVTDITEVAAGEAHAAAPTPGGGLCNMYRNGGGGANDPRIIQTILTLGELYAMSVDVDTYTSGLLRMGDADGFASMSITTTGHHVLVFVARSTAIALRTLVDPADVTFDNVSVRECHAEYIDPGSADVVYRANLTTPAAGTDPAGLILRRNGATQWLVQMTPGTAGTDFELIELNNGVPTSRAQADRDFAINTTYRIAVALTGQSIKVYQDGTERLSYATGTVGQTNTRFGIWDSAAANFRFDNAEITEYARYPHAGGY